MLELAGAKSREKICMLLLYYQELLKRISSPTYFPSFPLAAPTRKQSTAVYFHFCARLCSVPEGNKRLSLTFTEAIIGYRLFIKNV
jgi:hypothetical protein